MNRRILHIIEWTVVLAAYGYLTYRLVTYDNYPLVMAGLRAMGMSQWLALIACCALMPVNMLIEAWRWQTLMNRAGTGSRMSWREAQRQVYYSKMAGLITPWRLGEYPARALLMDRPSMPQVLSMGAVGSATMTAAIVGCGAIALLGLPAVSAMTGNGYLYILAAVGLVLVAALALAPKLLQRWAQVSQRTIGLSLLQSVLRLGCWCLQLALALYAFGAICNLQSAICYLFVYYLLLTITPNVPIAEVGVRGAWAMALFGTVNAALAGVVLWVVNTLLPCLCWLFMKKRA